MVAHKVKVVVRLRPKFSDEEEVCVEAVSDTAVDILNSRNQGECLRYEFSKVFNHETSQNEVFEYCVKPLLYDVTHGQNVSTFAYGPTGAGKTHTILGTVEDPGIIPRTLLELFAITSKQMKEDDTWKFTIRFSYLEIYNEKAIDLLSENKSQDLPIREDKRKRVFIAGLTELEIKTYDDFKRAFGPASQNRTTASTKLNEHSSRSHSILIIKVAKHQQCEPYRKLTGKMHLIDLAGSENNKRTGNKGIRLKESGAINTSLFVLGQVVDALNQGLPHIPYRDSKLTRLLQDSLGGNSHSVMITNLSPEMCMYLDTYTSLNIAQKTRSVVNKTIVNEELERPKLGKRVLPDKHKAAKRVRLSDKENSDDELDDIESLTEDESSSSIRLDPAPYLSPLLRKQNDADEALQVLTDRLEDLERKFMQKINAESDRVAEANVLKEQRNEIRQLKESISKSFKTKKGALEDIKSNAIRQITSSPLFFNPIGRIKRKPFKSTARRKILSDSESDDENRSNKRETSPVQPAVNTDVVERFSQEILRTLNTGSEKDILQLQTVGKKRCLLIIKYREVNGSFACIDDLDQVPGFSATFVQSFKKKNLIST
ncbi:kinesin-like protein KIF22 [Tubulanus polymorphus]|uniref:kinesin-like protein KIF22 n=1 Tax=Tubulanus polymorphus TaxID=672921 RepID=UPI003DA23E32